MGFIEKVAVKTKNMRNKRKYHNKLELFIIKRSTTSVEEEDMT